MYNISKITNDSRDFISLIPKISKGDREVIVFGLAKALANTLPLPSSPVESVSDYYTDNNYFKIVADVNYINELVVIDIERVLELVKTLWMTRYNMLYANRKLFKLTNTLAGLTFFNIPGRLSSNELEFITVNEIEIINIHNGFYQLLNELNSTDEVENVDDGPVVVLGR